MRSQTTIWSFLALVVFLTAAPPLAAQTQLRIHVVGNGGGIAASGGTAAKLTAGQRLIGITASSPPRAKLGFWCQFAGLTVVGIPGEAQTFDYHLHPNVPNPMTSNATLRFTLAQEERVQLDLFDMGGRRVERLVNETYPAGDHSLVYRADDLPGGVYLMLLQAGSYRTSRHLVLLK